MKILAFMQFLIFFQVANSNSFYQLLECEFMRLYPEIQSRIQEELDTIIGKHRDITSDDIKQMSYLEAVIKESLRLFPPVSAFSRKITNDIKLGDYVIPKGVSLYVLVSTLHMDSKEFPEPLAFKPERHLIENNSKNPFIFCPFSGGARNCIGQKFAINEIKIVLSKVLLNFNVKSLDQRNDIIICNVIVNKPKFNTKMGPRIQIFPRN